MWINILTIIISAIVGFIINNYFYWKTKIDYMAYEEEHIYRLLDLFNTSDNLHAVIHNNYKDNIDIALDNLSGGLNHRIAELVATTASHLETLKPNFKKTNTLKELMDRHLAKEQKKIV